MNKLRTIFIVISLLQLSNIFAGEPQIKKNINGFSYYEEARFKINEITKPFYFVRHGQTDVNKYGIILEDSDNIPLNENGVAQIENTAKLLKDKNIKVIITSPFPRARQTAEIINKELNVPIIYHDGLKEANTGTIVGENFTQSANRTLWREGGKVPNSEGLYPFEKRIHDSIKKIINKYDNALIVGHGVYFRHLAMLLNETDIKAENGTAFHLIPITDNTNKELYKITSLTPSNK